MSRNKERLYEAIEEAARTKSPIRIDIKEGDTLHLTMISDSKLLVEDLYWMDERQNICRAIVETGFEKRSGFMFAGLYVCGNRFLDGIGSGRTNMFRKENRYYTEKVDEEIRQIGKDLIEKHIGALTELAKGETTNE